VVVHLRHQHAGHAGRLRVCRLLRLPHLGIKGVLELAAALNCVMALASSSRSSRPPRAAGHPGHVAAGALVWVAYLTSWKLGRHVIGSGTYGFGPGFGITRRSCGTSSSGRFSSDGTASTPQSQFRTCGLQRPSGRCSSTAKRTHPPDWTCRRRNARPSADADRQSIDDVLVVGLGSGATVGAFGA